MVHEAPQTYGPAGELISLVGEKAFLHLEAPASRLTGFDIVIPLAKGEHHNIITKEEIIRKIDELIKY